MAVRLESWLSDFQDQRISDLWGFVGTHHSATSTWPPNFLKHVPYVWARTQSFTVSEQLCIGVRVLDVRVDSEFRVCHTLTNDVLLLSVLQEVKDFLNINPSEFVAILFKQDCSGGSIRISRDGPSIQKLLDILTTSALTFAEDFSMDEKQIGHFSGKCIFFLNDFHAFEFEETGFNVHTHAHRRDPLFRYASFSCKDVLEKQGKSPDDINLERHIHLHEYFGSGFDTPMQIWHTESLSCARSLVLQHLGHEFHGSDGANFGGVVLDGSYPPYPPVWTSPRMTHWFLKRFCSRTCMPAHEFLGKTEDAGTRSQNNSSSGSVDNSISSHERYYRLPHLSMFMCDFVTREIAETIISNNYLKRTLNAAKQADDCVIHDETRMLQLHSTLQSACLLNVFRVGPNNRGGVRRVYINPAGFALFNDLFKDDPVSDDAQSRRLIDIIRERYTKDSQLQPGTRCFAVEGYLTAHPDETFEVVAACLTKLGKASWRLGLDVRRSDRPEEGWGNELWLQFL